MMHISENNGYNYIEQVPCGKSDQNESLQLRMLKHAVLLKEIDIEAL